MVSIAETVTFGTARWIVATFAIRPLMSRLGQSRRFETAPLTSDHTNFGHGAAPR